MADDAPLVKLVDNTDRINERPAEHNTKSKMVIDGLGGADEGPGGIARGLACLGLPWLVRRRRQA